jgi:hypothetical protein
MGGVSIVVFGLIAVAGAKIWVDNKVDFSDNRNLVVAAITLVLGTGDYTLEVRWLHLGWHRYGHLWRHPAVGAAAQAGELIGGAEPRCAHGRKLPPR